MATVTKPIALDESINTTESPSRNIADVLAQELSGIASAITGGTDNVPKTDVATVEPSTTASRSYSVGELVYVNGNLYKVIASISQGSAFTVGTNIQSTTVSGAMGTSGDWEYLGQTTGNAEITIPNGAKEVYARAFYSSFSYSFHFLTVEADITIDRGDGFYVNSTNFANMNWQWVNSTRKAKMYGFGFAGTDYTSSVTTKWYVK